MTRSIPADVWDQRASEPRLAWLGQAGFALRMGGLNLLIDPYLSNHLGEKYAGTRFPHRRLMPPPLNVRQIEHIDYVLCTHRHGDHMDPPLLRELSERHPRLCFVIPEAVFDYAIDTVGLNRQRLIGMDAGRRIQLSEQLEVTGVASAHEGLETDDTGCHYFLGYVFNADGKTLYHSGDCVPYNGLAQSIREHAPTLALLPVNGRSELLQQAGVPGNFHLEEAIALCAEAKIPMMIAHHFGMFAFNTIAPDQIDKAAERHHREPKVVRPQSNLLYRLCT